MRRDGGPLFQIDEGDGYIQGPISLDQAVGSLPVVDDARWSADLTSNSWAALAVWLVLLVMLQAAMWPVVNRVFARFPDRGWGFGRLVTLMTAGYMVWLPSSIEVISFRAIWCAVAVVVVAVSSHVASRWLRGRSPAPGSLPWNRNTSIATAEVVFWAVFGLFLIFRLINHDSYHPAWGGEKPMEFAHINAILRSAHFPPYDPWYSDGILNYYYYGMYLVAFMMKLTGIPSEIAFNLAQPTMMALMASGAFSVASAITWSLSKSRALSRIGGLAGVILVSFSGNLVVAARLVSSIRESAPPLLDYGYWFWTPTRMLPRQTTIHEFPYFTGAYADLHAHVVALPMTVLVIGLCFAIAQNARAVRLATNRPAAFPGVTGTLVASAALLALTLASLFMTNAWDIPTYAALTGASMVLATRTVKSIPARLGIAAGLSLAVGLLCYLLVIPFSRHYVALYGDIAQNRDVTPLVAIEGHFGLFFVIVAFGLMFLLSRLWSDPPVICHPLVFLLTASAVLLGRWYGVDQSERWIEIADGLTVLVVVGWPFIGLVVAMNRRLDFRIGVWPVRLLVVAGWLLVLWAFAADRPAFGLFAGFGVAASLIWLMLRPAAERFVAMLIAAGMFVGAGVELVYLVDGLSGGIAYRMNTVFKFYNGIWVMLALACAALVAWMVRAAMDEGGQAIAAEAQAPHPARAGVSTGFALLGTESGLTGEADLNPVAKETAIATDDAGERTQTREVLTRSWAQLGLLVSGVAILASLAYPVFATGARLDQHFAQPGSSWTLNALDWMDYGLVPEYGRGGVLFAYDEDRDVIEWFNSEVPGSPVIAEASLNQYACAGSRIAVHTGLPVVVGWTWHESQQRGGVDLGQRQNDLRDLYTSTDPQQKLAIIQRYRIEYVVLGDLERHYPSNDCQSTNNSAGITAFEPLVGSNLEVAFKSGETVVYLVIRP